jgi:hypothetical protein
VKKTGIRRGRTSRCEDMEAAREFVQVHAQKGNKVTKVTMMRAKRINGGSFQVGVSKEAFDGASARLSKEGAQIRAHSYSAAKTNSCRMVRDADGKIRFSRIEYEGHCLPADDLLITAWYEVNLKPESFGCVERYEQVAKTTVKEYEFAGSTVVLMTTVDETEEAETSYEVFVLCAERDDVDLGLGALKVLLE